jgi:catechol 2,3-dioxygenase-like lactoylglutathione lyase family enzyme
MGHIEGVLHPVFVTGDLKGALRYYRDLLGFRIKSEIVHDPEALARLGGPTGAQATAVVLEAPDGSEIEIACFARPRGAARSDRRWQDAGIRSVTFVVTELDALLGKLRSEGYPPLGEVVGFVVAGRPVRVAYVYGPDGVIVTLLERAEMES